MKNECTYVPMGNGSLSLNNDVWGEWTGQEAVCNLEGGCSVIFLETDKESPSVFLCSSIDSVRPPNFRGIPGFLSYHCKAIKLGGFLDSFPISRGEEG